jgi:hypothetical protein
MSGASNLHGGLWLYSGLCLPVMIRHRSVSTNRSLDKTTHGLAVHLLIHCVEPDDRLASVGRRCRRRGAPGLPIDRGHRD